jgi:hypothetical protein
MKIKLHKDFLINELDLPDNAIKDTIISQSRWSTQHEIIFAHDGKFYKTHYSQGSTEAQDESAWEYDTEVECAEVHIVEKLIKTWEEK